MISAGANIYIKLRFFPDAVRVLKGINIDFESMAIHAKGIEAGVSSSTNLENESS